jgi:hypothetical protein
VNTQPNLKHINRTDASNSHSAKDVLFATISQIRVSTPPTTAASAAAVQALTEMLQPVTLSQHKLALPSFWTDDPAEWFQHAKAEFTLARLPANLSVCYIHVMCALFSEVLTTVQDLTKDITAATPEPYLLICTSLVLHCLAIAAEFSATQSTPYSVTAAPLLC